MKPKPKTKTCINCGQVKPLAEFRSDRRCTDGRRYTCMRCEVMFAKPARSKLTRPADPPPAPPPRRPSRPGSYTQLESRYLQHVAKVQGRSYRILTATDHLRLVLQFLTDLGYTVPDIHDTPEHKS